MPPNASYPLTKHCSTCDKDYYECDTCQAVFTSLTDFTKDPHCGENGKDGEDGKQEKEEDGEQNKDENVNTAKAAAAAAAGGLAAGTAGAAAVTAGAPAALGAVGFTSSGVAAGSIAASIQGPLTVAGEWFATCQSAAMGGTMGLAALSAVAATGGVVVAAGAGYGIYRAVKERQQNKCTTPSCPWCKLNGKKST